DFRDRAIIIELPVVPDDRRRTEEEVRARLEEARPRLLGALLDAVATALQRKDHVKPASLPRMADFTRWVAAASPALGWREGEFTKLGLESRDEAGLQALSLWPVMDALEHTLGHHEGAWEGTVGELLEALNRARPRSPGPPPADWPRSARALGGQVKRYE